MSIPLQLQKPALEDINMDKAREVILRVLGRDFQREEEVHAEFAAKREEKEKKKK